MYDHIQIPVAPDHEGEYTEALKLAQMLLNDGGKISVLSVVETVPAYVAAYIPNETMEGNTQAVLTDLTRAFGDAAQPHVVRGHPANSCLSWAEDNNVDCIIVSSHRPGFGDFFIGSTAARIVRHAQCSVVVLR